MQYTHVCMYEMYICICTHIYIHKHNIYACMTLVSICSEYTKYTKNGGEINWETLG